MSAKAFLKERGLGRIIAGHPWVYGSDLSRVEEAPPNGGEITVRTDDGSYVGTGFYNARSRIPVRIFSRSKEKLDAAFFRKRILDAKRYREEMLALHFASPLLNPEPRPVRSSFSEGGTPLSVSKEQPSGSCDQGSVIGPVSKIQNPKSTNASRLIWSEADFLPGLIVDRYDDALVVQWLTLALDQRKDLLAELLKEIYQPAMIVERNDVSSRAYEGLPLQKGVFWGDPNPIRRVSLGGVEFEVDLLQGQKTGAYLDQVANQKYVGQLARGRSVLDCFAYQGGFALHAALGGASQVEAWEISEEAIDLCKRNADLNGIRDVVWKAVNAFDEFKTVQRANRRFDLIILDPPSFTRSREKLNDALRGYKEIHLRALQLLNPGGMLATFCCSHHVDAETFRAVILDAAFDARKLLRLCHTFSQSSDHPIIPAIPESEYLKGFLFQIV